MASKRERIRTVNAWWNKLSLEQREMVRDTITLLHLVEFLNNPAKYTAYIRSLRESRESSRR